MKNSLKNKITRTLLPIMASTILLVSFQAFAAKTKAAKFTTLEHAVTQPSEDGKYIFTLHSTDPDIPFKKIHSWIVHIETKEGKPVEKAKVYVFGGMPVHQHDFPTKPKVKKYLGNGDYLVVGIKFNMPGEWEMRFNIKDGNTSSRVVFQFGLSH
jgi:hypothetical protein